MERSWKIYRALTAKRAHVALQGNVFVQLVRKECSQLTLERYGFTRITPRRLASSINHYSNREHMAK